jgi:hypothetical protein
MESGLMFIDNDENAYQMRYGHAFVAVHLQKYLGAQINPNTCGRQAMQRNLLTVVSGRRVLAKSNNSSKEQEPQIPIHGRGIAVALDCKLVKVYWDKEWELQQLGFDYTYDKRLLDRLHVKNIEEIRGISFVNSL